MALSILTNASSGATRNSGTNGDLGTLLDWALPQQGWAIEYTSGFARVYRPASGTRNRLHINHDSAVSGAAQRCVVRGCENASAAATLVDPYPTVAQVPNANCNWLVSSAASTVDRPFIILLSPTFLIYMSNFSGSTNVWDMGFFGDMSPEHTDPYCSVISQRNDTSNSSIAGLTQGCVQNLASSAGKVHWMRDITGATKSSYGSLYVSGSQLGIVASTASCRAGWGNKIFRERVGVNDLASTSTTASTLGLVKRGWVPNMWSGIQAGRGTVDDIDTFTDTAYNASASFRQLPSAIATSAVSVILEMTDTWVPP